MSQSPKGEIKVDKSSRREVAKNEIHSLIQKQDHLAVTLKKEIKEIFVLQKQVFSEEDYLQILAEKGVKLIVEENVNQYQQPLSPSRDKTSLSQKLDDKVVLKMMQKSSMKQLAREDYFAKKINNNISKLVQLCKYYQKSKYKIQQMQSNQFHLQQQQQAGSEYQADEWVDNNRRSLPEIKISKSQMQKGGHSHVFTQGLMDSYEDIDSSRNKIDKKLGQQMYSKLSLDALKTVNHSTRYISPYDMNFKSINVTRSNQLKQKSPIASKKKQNASQLLNSISQGVDMRSRAGTKNLGYGSISQVGNGFQSDVNRSFDRSELIVNAEPDVPLKVPLDINSLRYDNKAKLLKQKNLERFEKVAHNLNSQAEQEKHFIVQKLKKKQKMLKQIESNYKNERAVQNHEIQEKKQKAQLILDAKIQKTKQQEKRSMKDYKKWIKELKQGFPDPKTPPRLTEEEVQKQKIDKLKLEEQKNAMNIVQDLNQDSKSTAQRTQMSKMQQNIVNYYTSDEDLDKVELGMQKYSLKMNRSVINQGQYLSKIQHNNSEYHKKVLERGLAKKIKDADENAVFGNFHLPHAKGQSLEELEDRRKQGQNMRDIAINLKYENATKKQDQIQKWKKQQIQEKNLERFEKYLKKNGQIKDQTKEHNRVLNKKMKKENDLVKQSMLSKIEIISANKEMKFLQKIDQVKNFESIKKQHSDNMLRLQAKHFGFDVKNKLNKLQFDSVLQKNMIKEQGKMNELSLNDPLTTHNIRPVRQQWEMQQMVEKFHSQEEGKPSGLKTMNKYRQPVVKDA